MSAASPPARAGASLLEGLFPPGVMAATAPVTDDETGLFAEERLLVASAVAKRRREFAAARRCARELLARLGEPARPILRTADRAPIWPSAVVGSISHSDALAAVAVAPRARFPGLGIDVEPDAPLERDLWRKICTPRERERLAAAGEPGPGSTVRLVFGAKETVYKCVFPHVGRFIGFQEVEVMLEPDGRFTAMLPEDVDAALPAGWTFAGRAALRNGLVVTAGWLARAPMAGGSSSEEMDGWR